MPDERQSHPGRRSVVVSMLLALAAHLLLLIAAVVMSRQVPAAVAVIVLAAFVVGAAARISAAGLAQISRHLRNERRLLVRALTDPVTGLPVRRVVEDAIADTDPDSTLTVALIDVDGMHDINTAHNHGGGDHFLAVLADRLCQASEPGDVVARLGGDEFVIVTARSVVALEVALAAAVAAPVTIGTVVRPMRVSVGLCRTPGGDPYVALGRADRAMYTAKRLGGAIVRYDPGRDGEPPARQARPVLRRRDRRGEQHDTRYGGVERPPPSR